MKKINKKTILILITIAIVLVAAILIGKAGSGTANNIDKKVVLDAGNELEITQIGKYEGLYMEDASDEEVSNVMMIQVTNAGDEVVQYAEITLSGEGEDDAVFKFSTLEPGATMTVLEANRLKYKRSLKYTQAVSSNVAHFTHELTTYPEKLQIQPLDGGLNVTNISGQDIKGEIVIYFKDTADNMLMGGITYRGRITDGLGAGEIRQLMSENFTKENTKVMFITIDGK